jgi:DNA-binding phage protein
MSIEEVLRSTMVARRMPPFALAKQAGLSGRQVARFLAGDGTLSIHAASVLADALGLVLINKSELSSGLLYSDKFSDTLRI